MNCKVFTKNDVMRGLHLRLIDYLCSYNLETDSNEFFDIHISTDGESIIVEWVDSSLVFPSEYFELVDMYDDDEDEEAYYD